MKIKYWLIGLLFLPMALMAQQKDLTLQDLIPGGKNYAKFVPKSLAQLQWNGDAYLYAKGDTVWTGEAPKWKKSVLLTKAGLNEALEAAGQKKVGSLPYFSVPYAGQSLLSFMANQHLFHYNYAEKRIVADYALQPGWSNYDFCPENRYLAFTEGNNLKILSSENQVTDVTNETADGIVCGQSVHQNEFGIHKGIFWSPKGSALAFYRMDESMVTEYPIVAFKLLFAALQAHDSFYNLFFVHVFSKNPFFSLKSVVLFST